MISSLNQGSVIAVCKKAEPGLPKLEVDAIQLSENYGVEGDYHAGEFVRHRYLAKKDPTCPNLRQVLLIDTKILADITTQDIHLEPGMLGENMIIDGISLMDLPIGAQIEVGETLLELTEVRNPCYQLVEMQPGLQNAVQNKIAGREHRNAGMMAKILRGGWVQPGDPVILLDKQV